MKMLEQNLVQIRTSEFRISRDFLNLVDAFPRLHQREIERSGTQVDNEYSFALGFPRWLRQTRCCWFVDQPEQFNASNFRRSSGRLLLSFIEVRRDRDHRLYKCRCGRVLSQVIHNPIRWHSLARLAASKYGNSFADFSAEIFAGPLLRALENSR